MSTTRTRLPGAAAARSAAMKAARLSSSATQCEQLLELVDDEQQLGRLVGQEARRRPGETRLRFEAPRQAGRRRGVARPTSAAASSANGSSPGLISATKTRGEPARTAGTSPARTTEDLPLPEGPTSATRREPDVAAQAAGQPADEALASVEVGGVRLEERAQALVRVASRPGGNRHRAAPDRAASASAATIADASG